MFQKKTIEAASVLRAKMPQNAIDDNGDLLENYIKWLSQATF